MTKFEIDIIKKMIEDADKRSIADNVKLSDDLYNHRSTKEILTSYTMLIQNRAIATTLRYLLKYFAPVNEEEIKDAQKT